MTRDLRLSCRSESSRAEEFRCIWMQAGVVPHKRCRKGFQCAACPYDRAMRRAAEENSYRRTAGQQPRPRRKTIVHWQDRLRRLPYLKRPCIHSMKGEIEFRPCTQDYNCYECDFHQYFQDVFTVYATVKPVDYLSVKSFCIPQGYYLHPGHAWVKAETAGFVRIGLDDFVHRVFGPLGRIEAPLTGKRVTQGQPGLTLVRGRRKAAVLSPVSGVVSEVNSNIRADATAGRLTPYSNGWIMRVHVSNLRDQMPNLLLGGQAGEFLEGEINALQARIEEIQGPLAADGGQLVDDLFGAVPAIGWRHLCRRVLRTC